ncbi:MAG: hypothetical protein KGJ34_00260 [Patescibacteria group bacterium]|nr:hypothetical protein [Patescibacteria group bacterium]
MNKDWFIILILVILAGGVSYFVLRPGAPLPQGGVMASTTSEFPATTTFSGANAEASISISSPNAGDLVSSPLIVNGEATSSWYVEGQFPVILEDANGNIIVQTSANAEENSTSSKFISFSATLNFTQPQTATGTLILENKNSSGDPSRNQSASIPVRFQ